MIPLEAHLATLRAAADQERDPMVEEWLERRQAGELKTSLTGLGIAFVLMLSAARWSPDLAEILVVMGGGLMIASFGLLGTVWFGTRQMPATLLGNLRRRALLVCAWIATFSLPWLWVRTALRWYEVQ